MGYYINPKSMSKEEWLEHNSHAIEGPVWPEGKDTALVCLVNNGPFNAAAICYSKGEMQDFALPDGRKKWWFEVPKALLVAEGFIREEMFS